MKAQTAYIRMHTSIYNYQYISQMNAPTQLHMLLHMPIQLLKPAVRDFTFDRLHLSYHKCRSVLQHNATVDRSVFKNALLPQSEGEKHGVLSHTHDDHFTSWMKAYQHLDAYQAFTDIMKLDSLVADAVSTLFLYLSPVAWGKQKKNEN